jgi:ABC-type amino acid transport substrate-binding protein
VAVAIFGEDGHVKYEETTAFERFSALAEGTVDLLARGTTLTMERSLREVRTSQKNNILIECHRDAAVSQF